MSWDRLSESSDAAVAEGQRRQARQMFRFADEASCRHQALVRHFGERIDRCERACDLCTGEELLAATKPVAPRRVAPARRKRRPPRRG
jgi:ATP-dependent DNA helicase RecQ